MNIFQEAETVLLQADLTPKVKSYEVVEFHELPNAHGTFCATILSDADHNTLKKWLTKAGGAVQSITSLETPGAKRTKYRVTFKPQGRDEEIRE